MDSASWILGICLILSIAGNVFLPYFLTKLHQLEKKQLHDRLMARDYPEFMQGKDYELELKRKEQEIDNEKKPIKEKGLGLSKAEIEDRKVAEEF